MSYFKSVFFLLLPGQLTFLLAILNLLYCLPLITPEYIFDDLKGGVRILQSDTKGCHLA